MDVRDVGTGTRAQRVAGLTVSASARDGSLLHARGALLAGAQADPLSVQERMVLVDAGAPLALGIAALPDPVVSGGVVALEVQVSNVGTEPLTGVKVVFPVPDGLGFAYASGADPTRRVSAAGARRTCTAIRARKRAGTWGRWIGAKCTIQVTADVAEGLVGGTLLTVPVRASSSSGLTATVEWTLSIQ